MVSVNMDASPVQSSSKCTSTDFSIERLLSGDTKSREDSVDTPDWLCCTRYRPPRLPRAAVSRARRAGRHARVPFTATQATALEAAYARAPYLAPPALRALAAALQLRDDRIKIWFQNRRARERREKCVNISPPDAITLPPTHPVSTYPSNSWRSHTDFGTSIFTDGRVNIEKIINGQNLMRNCFRSFTTDSDDERSEEPLDIESVED